MARSQGKFKWKVNTNTRCPKSESDIAWTALEARVMYGRQQMHGRTYKQADACMQRECAQHTCACVHAYTCTYASELRPSNHGRPIQLRHWTVFSC